ncbi:MAG: hypothetical protein IJ890_05675 [Clostridia bacterium]|nr:hypothetical protein [Clostridia bacterium]
MVRKIVKKEIVLNNFLKKFSVLNDTGYTEYDVYMDMGRIRVEIKHKDKMLYFMEYNEQTKGIESNEVQDSKMYKLLKTFLKDYYELGKI